MGKNVTKKQNAYLEFAFRASLKMYDNMYIEYIITKNI